MSKFIGIDIGGTNIKFAILTDYGTVLEKWIISTNIENNGQHIPNDIANSIYQKLPLLNISLTDIKAVGIGVPGPISKSGDKVIVAVNLGWEHFALKTLLEERLRLPVFLLNDANAAGLGEMWLGAGKGNSNLLFVTLGTGVGGCVIIDGKIIVGSNSAGGEIGHIPVFSTDNRVCGCGNKNCLETFASATGMVKTARKYFEKANRTLPDDFSTKDLFELISTNDPIAVEVLDETLTILAQSLSAIENTLDLDEIIIGGGVSLAGNALIGTLKKKMDLYLFPSIKGKINIRQAELGNNAGVIGACYYAISHSN